MELCCLKCQRKVLVKVVLTVWRIATRWGYCTNCGQVLFKESKGRTPFKEG